MEHPPVAAPPPSPEEAFGQALRARREARGLSQEALALESGYHPTYISLLERGKKSPSLGALFRLAAILATPPSELVREAEMAAGEPGARASWRHRPKPD